MAMVRNGYGTKWQWYEMVMVRKYFSLWYEMAGTKWLWYEMTVILLKLPSVNARRRYQNYKRDNPESMTRRIQNSNGTIMIWQEMVFVVGQNVNCIK